MTMEEFTSKRQKQGWYRLSGSVPDGRNTAFLRSSRSDFDEPTNRVSFAMIPERSVSAKATQSKAKLAFFTDDDSLRAALGRLTPVGKKTAGSPDSGGVESNTMLLNDFMINGVPAKDKPASDSQYNQIDPLEFRKELFGRVLPVTYLKDSRKQLFDAYSQLYEPGADALIEGAKPQDDESSGTIVAIFGVLALFGAIVGPILLIRGMLQFARGRR